MNALRKIAEFAFECHHSQLSRVFTIRKRTYRVCFQCGKEVDYSWELMRSQEPIVAANRLDLKKQNARVAMINIAQ
jgi:hypothetical protein